MKTHTEKQFIELLKDIKSPSFYSKAYIKLLKDISHQSFNGVSIFHSPLVNNNPSAPSVQYKEGAFRNLCSPVKWRKQVPYKVQYSEVISGITIPLHCKHTDLYTKARLVISVPMYGSYQISVQLFLNKMHEWISIPCTTSNVRDTIIGILPQE